MKKNNIKKRLAALRSGLMLSLFVISPFSVFKAANISVIVTNDYGSFTRGNWSASILNTTYSTSAVIGELNGVYNGRVTINYSTDPTTTSLLFIPINCMLESTSGNSITIIFKNVSSFMVLIDGSGADSLQVNSMTNWNMTKLTDGTNTQLNSVLSYIDNIETLLTTNNTTLGLIYNYIQTLDTSNTDISIDVGDISVDVNDIEVGIGDLLSAITSMITDGIDTITLGDLLDQLEECNSYLANINSRMITIQGTLQSAVTHLSNIANNTSQINNNVYDIELITGVINQNIVAAKNDIADLKSYVNTIVTTLNSINNALSDIDNTIDTITWLGKSQLTYTYSDSSQGTYSDLTVSTTYSNRIYVKIPGYNMIENNRIYHIRLPLYTDIFDISNIGILTLDEYGNTYISDIYFELRNNRNIDIYVHIPETRYTHFVLRVTSTQPLKTPSSFTEINSLFEYIQDTDIEYWHLLDSIKTYKYRVDLLNKINTLTPINYNSVLNDIITAINNLEINYNVSTDIQTDIDSSIEAINDIDTVINNEINIFNNNKDSILSSFITPPDITEFKRFMNSFIFVDELGYLYKTFISMMLFMTFVLVLLG